jgi:hypothetical protein
MPEGKADIVCDLERLQRAQILLDLFEEDYGRAAVTMKEVGVWAIKNRDHLELRMEHRLLELLRRNPDDSKQHANADIGVRRPPPGWRSVRRNPTRGLNLLRRIWREPHA